MKFEVVLEIEIDEEDEDVAFARKKNVPLESVLWGVVHDEIISIAEKGAKTISVECVAKGNMEKGEYLWHKHSKGAPE